MNEKAKPSPLGTWTTSQFTYSNAFLNDGGPLVVLPRSLLGSWHGAVLPWTEELGRRFGERVADFLEGYFERFTDFARATRARGWFDVIPVKSGQAMVIGPESGDCSARWLRSIPDGREYLLAISAIDPGAETAVADAVLTMPDDAWSGLGKVFHIPDDELVMLHAGSNGDWTDEVPPERPAAMGGRIVWRVPAGSYALRGASIVVDEPGAGAELEACWLCRI